MEKSHTFWAAVLAVFLVGAPAHAQLSATSSDDWPGNVGLEFSKVKVTVGPLWLDIEEEAELSAAPAYGEGYGIGPWLISGNFDVPRGTVVTGCLLWNNDTLLMGKLRGRADATQKFDSLVPPLPSAYRYDPLQIDQVGDSTYHLKLYPVADGGTRRIRIRYLVPVTSTAGDVPVLPVLSQALTGTSVPSWSLDVRGAASGLKIFHDGAWFPLAPPASRNLDFATCGAVHLRWTSLAPDGSRAIRGRIDTGAWQGDYVLFTGRIPDSIGRRLDIRSETVFLWRWIQPGSFFDNYYGGRYLTSYGQEAIDQAQKMVGLAGQLAGTGSKVGLVADQGSGDTSAVVFPLSDSAGSDFRRMNTWLNGIDVNYLSARIPVPASSGGSSGNLDIAKNRQSFRADLREAAVLYSRDSGIVRHLVVVTVGPVATGGDYQEMPDLSGLPATVSVSSSQLIQGIGYQWTCSNSGDCGYMVADTPPLRSQWPGIDLDGVQAVRLGSVNLDSIQGVRLPRIRTRVSANLSMTSSQGSLQKDVVIQRGPDGSWTAGINAQAKGIGNQVTWNFFDDSANVVASWSQTPAWIVANGDSVLPRLWAVSPGKITPNFVGKTSIAPIFGFVDRQYSLLATPADSMGRERQRAYVDSGVPFLSSKDIFAKVGYGEDRSSGVRSVVQAKTGLSVRLLAGVRKVSIEFAGLDPLSIEIRDLRGHKVADWSRQSLVGKTSVTWNGRNSSEGSAPSGLYVVVLRTTKGSFAAQVALP